MERKHRTQAATDYVSRIVIYKDAATMAKEAFEAGAKWAVKDVTEAGAKAMYDFACSVYWMREAQREYHKLRYSNNVQKRGEIGHRMAELQKQVDTAIDEICRQYAEGYL